MTALRTGCRSVVSSSLGAALFAVLLASLPSPLSAQRRPSTDRLKDEVLQEVASMQKLSQEMVDMVFSFSELGFQEEWTVEYLTGILEREGFRVERGCAGMPTCYVASWGSGRPVIGIMGDIDGLPETSQKPGVAYHDPLIPGGPGHGEGHNSAPAVDIVAAIAVKRVMERHGLPGEIRVIPASRKSSSRAGRAHGQCRALPRCGRDALDARLERFSTSWGSAAQARLDDVHLPRPVGAQCRVAVGRAGALGAVRGTTMAGTTAASTSSSAAFALRDLNGGSQPDIVPSGGVGLVLLPRTRLPADQGAARARPDDGQAAR